MERDYSPKGVKFFYIYKSLAHPEINGYIAPFTKKERLMHIAEAKKKLGTRINWIGDSMSNDLKHALGNAPNSEFVIDPDGKIVRARRWSRPSELRKDLASLVGEVNEPTKVSDLGMKRLEPPKTAQKGVVPRVKLPESMVAVKVRPAMEPMTDRSTSPPFYVKLRAEVESQYFQEGTGKLYLGFFLDPLYKVHWNNRVMPVRYQIETTDGLQISPTQGKGPDVKVDADADPREFLVDLCDLYLDESSAANPIILTIQYFACDDAETFCKQVTQRYQITLERDPDGGSRGGFRRGGSFGGRGGRGPFGR